MNVMIRIADAKSFVKLIVELKSKGLLKNLPNELEIDEEMFPLDIPLDVETILNMINPVTKKMFEKRINATLMEHIASVIGG